MKAAIYARVSTDQQGETPVEDQLKRARAFAQKHGHTIVAEYTDTGQSGYTDDRPNYVRMKADWGMTKNAKGHVVWEAGKFDLVIAWDADRISRNPGELHERLIACFESRGAH